MPLENSQESEIGLFKDIDKTYQSLSDQVLRDEESPEDLYLTTDNILLTSVLLVVAKYFYGRNFEADLMRLQEQKPLRDLTVIEFGFGSPNDQSFKSISEFGADVYAIEPSESAVEDAAQGWFPELQDKVKSGVAQDIPEKFPGIEFDAIISSRVIEEWPMAESGEIQEGINKALDILRTTLNSLKTKGFSIHVTTMPFLIDDITTLGKMGYQVVALNKRLGSDNYLLTSSRYYTILQKE